MTGQTISHYRIGEKLGEGGMGVVYKAEDSKLKRTVALKFLPRAALDEPELRARFLQEAQAAAALNHPNVCTIYEVDEERGFLAMEFLEGETVRVKAQRRPLPITEALDIAMQTARGLQAAHERGVVHRDITSANLMVSPQGAVKIMDFGLAHLTGRTRVTRSGQAVGTPAYMSPEQTEGGVVDRRSDLWSLGVVLYQMLTGQLPFRGDSQAAVAHSILYADPEPVTGLRVGLPLDLDRVIGKALTKDPGERYQHADDLLVDLRTLRGRLELESKTDRRTAAAPPKLRKRNWIRASAFVTSVLCICALAFYYWSTRPRGPTAPKTPIRLTRDRGLTAFPVLSSDGRLLVFASDREGENNLDIYLRQVEGAQPIQLTRHQADDYDPALCPDDTHIAFRSDRDGGGIYVVPTLGGEERLLVPGGRRPRFSPDGEWILYWVGHPAIANRAGGSIYVVAASGGSPRRLAADFDGAGYPIWAPTGRRILFLGRKQFGGPYYWWVSSVDDDAPRPVDASRNQSASPPEIWLPGGVIHSAGAAEERNLWQQPLSETTLERTGEPRQLTFGLGREGQGSVTSAGDLAFAAASVVTDLWMIPFDARSGKPTGEVRPITRDESTKWDHRVSGDGRTLVYDSNRGGNPAVWLRDFETGKESLLAQGTGPRLSRDGKILFYQAGEGGKPANYLLNRANNVPEKAHAAAVWSLSSDGKLGLEPTAGAGSLQVVDLSTGRATLLVPPGLYPMVYQASFSPDDRWVAFVAKTGPELSQLFVVSYRNGVTPKRGDWIQVTDGASWVATPQWSQHGELLYFAAEKDGYRCLWAHRMNPATQQPTGNAFTALHFHDVQRPSLYGFMIGAGELTIQFAVASDKVVYNLTQATGNIWMTKLGGR